MNKTTRSIFIGHTSFEERCMGYLRGEPREFDHGIIVSTASSLSNSIYRENQAKLTDLANTMCSDRVENIVVDREHQLSYLSELHQEYARFSNIGEIVVDISTFPKDRLLMTLNYARRLVDPSNISVVVSKPGSYATEAPSGDRWLSKGVKRIEPVIGFNGHQRSRLECMLILQLGHEQERPRIVTTHLEPDIVAILGQGQSQHNDKSYETYRKNNENLLVDLKSKTVSYCEIDHLDWLATRNEIARLCCEYADTHNIFIAHHGTKEQLLGAFGAALTFQDIQLVYAEPQTYNFKASAGVGGISIFSLREIIGHDVHADTTNHANI